MVTCSNCQQLNEDHNTVCIHCGHALKDEAAATVETVSPQESKLNPEQGGPTPGAGAAGFSKEKWDPYLQKGKVVANDYWSYFINKWKSPVMNGLVMKPEQWINGLITLIGFILFFSLYTVVVMRGIRIGMFGGSSGFSVFFSTLLHTTLLVSVTLAMLWVAVKFFIRKEVSFKEVLVRYSSLTVIPASLTAAAFLLALLTLIQLSSLVLLFVLIGWLTAVTLTVYSYYKETAKPGMDPMYSLFIVFGAIGLYVYLFGDSMVGSLLGFL
ncbi:zinc ribbon domain-containing protein [Paenibacillus senegalensis]|uniref:zinc ribbon domain-containing protein n=1 Tax=Paenibacillus senegalensis TaxID=1465766 RepID=UPI00028A27CA|nr:zinc ribbon domain-containing protein [Paenibacillus senegalensis]